ncbi:MAG: hypothetical protein EZS28_056204 [Streblomastix strix]|uniref:Uncharacterized protein n=1 Tax=Streblomastix strix TaxID=222440 RepID=A0A5J4PNB1_9EUKA|nr:MAG: hypothetical protein EZS28_056204 [Streblomastix strix]
MRRNILCGSGSYLSVSGDSFYDNSGKQISPSKWVYAGESSGSTTGSCMLTGDSTTFSQAPTFIPTVSNMEGRLNDPRTQLTITVQGSQLIPCVLVEVIGPYFPDPVGFLYDPGLDLDLALSE